MPDSCCFVRRPQNEVAAKERMEAMWKAEQERRAKAGEDYQNGQKSRALVEQVTGLTQ